MKCGVELDLVTPARRMLDANKRILSQFRCLAETATGKPNTQILKDNPRPAAARSGATRSAPLALNSWLDTWLGGVCARASAGSEGCC